MPGQRLVHLPPFLAAWDLPPLPPRSALPTILCVGMMRPGDKAASYRIVAEVLAHLKTPDWHLRIAGDGPERAAIEAIFAPFGNRVSFLGLLDAAQLQREYVRASVLLWPGVNEAFGLVYLEAQAAGLPVVAQDRPGVRDVVIPVALAPVEGGAQALALATDALLQNPALQRKRASEGCRAVAELHLLGPARTILIEHISLPCWAPKHDAACYIATWTHELEPRRSHSGPNRCATRPPSGGRAFRSPLASRMGRR